MNNTEVLYKPFDIDVHADNFVNYLEVIIRSDGTIEYAVPSHTIKLENICKEKFGVEKFKQMVEDLAEYVDYMDWLCAESGCVSVWNDFCVKPEHITREQIDSLFELHDKTYTHGGMSLYRGGF